MSRYNLKSPLSLKTLDCTMTTDPTRPHSGGSCSPTTPAFSDTVRPLSDDCISPELDLYLLSQKWKELVEKAKAKQLQPDEYNSWTLTLSNLGMFGVDRFDVILPPGQGAIMAVGASRPSVVANADGFFNVKNKMLMRGLSLDAADQKLIKEIAELAKIQRAWIERMKTLKELKVAKASSTSLALNGSSLALLFTVFFFLCYFLKGQL
ncbi:hypothetical protein P3S67_015537 [Capsicum chacoense]